MKKASKPDVMGEIDELVRCQELVNGGIYRSTPLVFEMALAGAPRSLETPPTRYFISMWVHVGFSTCKQTLFITEN